MSAHRILLVENQADLSILDGRLRLRRDGMDDAFVLPNDIAVLILHHHTIRITVHVLRTLAQSGSMILVTDERHYPAGMLWPWAGGSVLARRLRQQITLDASTKKTVLWGQLVQGRIATQALNLRHFSYNGALRLERLCRKVRPGDPDNLEAQATRHYWRCLLPAGIHREKQGSTEPLNVRLNFGFAVLRSLLAREIAAAGLNPALGLGHHNLENPFNLADDLMEPYRFVVERHVLTADTGLPFDSTARVALLNFFSTEVELAGCSFRLPSAVAETVSSLTRVLNKKQTCLNIPGASCQPMPGG
ncbi:MAG: type II CRISPR-associated endonuclease Cas1 [Gammaproteobacteria bacterium]|nr:type II CRISPR-associated endonuclease Cas1 [Gammaproteobacteria bacterium]